MTVVGVSYSWYKGKRREKKKADRNSIKGEIQREKRLMPAATVDLTTN